MSRGEAKWKTYTAVMKASTTPLGGNGVVRAQCSLAATFTDGRGGCGACDAVGGEFPSTYSTCYTLVSIMICN
jgi:hypothetical protein